MACGEVGGVAFQAASSLEGEAGREEPAVGGNNLPCSCNASFLAPGGSEQHPGVWGSRGEFAQVTRDISTLSFPAFCQLWIHLYHSSKLGLDRVL